VCVCGGDPRLRPLWPKTLETPPKNNNNRSTHKFTEPKREGLAVCVGVYHCWVYIILLLYVYIIVLLLLSYDYAVINAVQKTGNELNKNRIGGGWYNVEGKHIYIYIVLTIIINTMAITIIVRQNYDGGGDETVRLRRTFEHRGFNIIYVCIFCVSLLRYGNIN